MEKAIAPFYKGSMNRWECGFSVWLWMSVLVKKIFFLKRFLSERFRCVLRKVCAQSGNMKKTLSGFSFISALLSAGSVKASCLIGGVKSANKRILVLLHSY